MLPQPEQAAPSDPVTSILPQRTRATGYAATGRKPVAIIGAGFSGTMTALQLLRCLPAEQPVLLCERSAEFASGVAYAAGDNEHLLNVRAANMSALSDNPTHFTDWLSRRMSAMGGALAGVHQTETGLFASRGLYGRYLRAILDEAMRHTVGDAQLRLLPDHVVDVEPCKTAGNLDGYTLLCESGQRIDVSAVVIAVGNLPAEEADDGRVCRNPWEPKAWRPLDPDRPVLIVGTGLTMVDLALGLRRRGFTGRLIALSRGGLLATGHAPAAAWPTPVLTRVEERSIRRLTARLRREIAEAREQGVDWRAVIDSLRPITAHLWGTLPDQERRRFLRHLRRYWDVHRHRMAPLHADHIARLQADGTLRIVAGRIVAIDARDDGVGVTYRPRACAADPAPQDHTLDVQRVIIASGVEHLSRTNDRLMQNLLDRGMVRPDAQGMGIDVDSNLNAVQSDGIAARNLWALGPIVRGVLWECVAVPDIRVQAGHLAHRLADRLREDAAHWSFAI